jgi:transcriptional regulator with XRE-family HTH domain
MAEVAHPIEIDLPSKLQDKEYRQGYFLAEASADLAEQIAALRKRRGLNQTQLAEQVGTKQPAISRVEQADYQNWNFGTVQKIVGALDGRMRVIVEAAEDVLPEYEQEEKREDTEFHDDDAQGAIASIVIDAGVIQNLMSLNVGSYVINNLNLCDGLVFGVGSQPNQGPFPRINPVNSFSEKNAEIARLKKRVAELEAKEAATGAVSYGTANFQARIPTIFDRLGLPNYSLVDGT